jgi:hypothetical protein
VVVYVCLSTDVLLGFAIGIDDVKRHGDILDEGGVPFRTCPDRYAPVERIAPCAEGPGCGRCASAG